MQQKIQLRIDISNDNINPFKVTQHDNMARALEITLINNGVAFTDYTGVASIVVAFKKSDSKSVIQTVEIPQNGQPILVLLKAQTLSTVGTIYGQISLLGANQEKLGTGKFVGTVGEDLAQNAIESSNDWGDLQKAVDLAKNADKLNADENTRKINEDLRIANENTRIANERERDVSFKQSQIQRDTAFKSSQDSKQTVFEASERTRQSTFNTNEAERASNDVQIRNQMTELLKVTGTAGTAETELLGARVDKSGKVYGNIGERFDNLDNDKLTSLETDASLTKLNSVVDGNVIIDKIQGRTLVNLITVNTANDIVIDKNIDIDSRYTRYVLAHCTGAGSKTLIVNLKQLTATNGFNLSIEYQDPSHVRSYHHLSSVAKLITLDLSTIASHSDIVAIGLYIEISNFDAGEKAVYNNVMLIEGEVQNPPAYFTGMKSVGEDNGNKIEISSRPNLILPVRQTDISNKQTVDLEVVNLNGLKVGDKVDFLSSKKTLLLSKISVTKIVGNTITLDFGSVNSKYTYIFTDQFLLAVGDKSEISLTAPLREFDYIAKDGVHRKNYKATFDGSVDENWLTAGTQPSENMLICRINFSNGFDFSPAICDRFNRNTGIYTVSDEGFYVNSSGLHVKILKSKLSSPDVQGFKAWLQANPITVIYETTTETIEPINSSLVLQSFKDGYFGMNSGAINPTVSLSFPTTIGGRVDSLEESNYQLKKDYYSTLKTLIKTADDCLKLELSKQNKTDNSLSTTDKTIVGSINELNNNKVEKIIGKGLSTNDFTNEYMLMLDNMKTEIANLLLPVGITVAYQTNINPNALYTGQTWVRSFKGQVMVGVDETQTEFNAIDKTGGEKVHVLTSEEAPNKGVDMLCRNNSGSLSGYGVATNNEGNLMWEEGKVKITGGGQPHNNLQPYKTTYFWTRTA